MRPAEQPIGRAVALASKRITTAFNASLATEGGSVPAWLILTALRGSRWRTQRDLAGSLGIVGPTLTRHIDNLEQQGWVRRARDTHDRRAVRVEITDKGVEVLTEMKGLEFLNIQKTQISEASIGKLQKALPGATVRH